MRKTFDYLYQENPLDSIEVEDIGNCVIQAFNDMGYEWYLIIETSLGDSYIQEFGPFFPDIENYFPKGFKYNFYKLQYKESKLSKIIENFINDPKKLITQVLCIEEEIAYKKLLGIDFRHIGFNE